MGKKDESEKEAAAVTRVEAVLQQLRKQSPPLTVNQEKFCDEACAERFLEKVKGDNPKKAAKLLRACLSWRQSVGIEDMTADEFQAELAEGAAYVAGHDEECRPVVILRIKQEYHKFNSQKVLSRVVAFTLEVAIGTMPKNVHQLVLIFDAGLFRSGSAFVSMLMATLKMMGDYYPGRLHRAFVVDPPSLFSYLWKGVKPFVELSSVTFLVSSLDFADALGFGDFVPCPSRTTSSLRFDPSAAKLGSCSSSRFAFTVSHHLDSLKPWYLTLTDAKSGPTTPFSVSLGPALVSPVNARSLSFASPAARGMFPSTPLPQRVTPRSEDASAGQHPATPGPGFRHSWGGAFYRGRTGCRVRERSEQTRESFSQLVKLYRRPYDVMAYRSMMTPPLRGRRQHHVSASRKRF
ncbi:hypothetical protein MLD38_012011 [Melastoma candidum]|uniref:Uncharacterized protein n=1 Tax=Melastoma candidum TaxID=119954 RepID=A0ACB9R8H9_9MYRT|nr:hypothetical protein MLD38_012011 [Melastoma candidum]